MNTGVNIGVPFPIVIAVKHSTFAEAFECLVGFWTCPLRQSNADIVLTGRCDTYYY